MAVNTNTVHVPFTSSNNIDLNLSKRGYSYYSDRIYCILLIDFEVDALEGESFISQYTGHWMEYQF